MSRRPPSLLVLHDIAYCVPLEAVMVSCTQAEIVKEGPVCVEDDVVVPNSEDELLLDKLLERLLEMLLDVAIELVTSVEVDEITLELLDDDDPLLF